MEINLGPLSLRVHAHRNWSNIELGFTSNRDGGMAVRETAIRVGFKSEHLIDALGTDNPNDTYLAPDGTTILGKICVLPGKGVHVLDARQVYALQLHKETVSSANKVAAAALDVKSIPAGVSLKAVPAPEPA